VTTNRHSLNAAIIAVRACEFGKALETEALRMITNHPSIDRKICEIVEELANEEDLLLPGRLEAREMCRAKLVELIRRPKEPPEIEVLEVTVLRLLRSKVVAEYIRTREASTPLSSEARQYVRNRRRAEDAGIEPTEKAWVEYFQVSAEEYRAARLAYGLSRPRSLCGDWAARGTRSFVGAVRRGRRGHPAGCIRGDGETLDVEILCDLHDKDGA